MDQKNQKGQILEWKEEESRGRWGRWGRWALRISSVGFGVERIFPNPQREF